MNRLPGESVLANRTAFRLSLAPTVVRDDRAASARTTALVAYLERALGRPVGIVQEASYAAAQAALRAGRLDAAMLGEAASRQVEESGGGVPLLAPTAAGTDDAAASTYQSAIFTRLDSAIHDLSGLRG